MRVKDYGRFSRLFAVMAAVALVLAVIGMIRLSTTPYAGFRATADFRAFNIAPSGPAATAGMKAGDLIVAINGIPTENLHDTMIQKRPPIGETLKVSVMRDRVRHEIEIVQTPLPGRVAMLAWIGNLMALVMLALGLAIYWIRPNKASTLFFLANLSFSLVFATPPYFQALIIRTIVAVNAIFFLTMGLAFLLHLSIIFPKPKPLVRETGAIEYLIYLPAPVMALSYLGLRLFLPSADLLVNMMLHGFFAILLLLCIGMALVAVIHSYWTARAVWGSGTLAAMMVAVLVGSILPAAKLIIDTFVPDSPLPGQAAYPLTAILVSLGFGLALWNAPETGEEHPHLRPLIFRRASGL